MTIAMKVSQRKAVAGLFCFSFSIILALSNPAAGVDLCGVGKIEGKNFTLSLNFSKEDVMKNGGECSRVVILESAQVKLVVEESNLATGTVFEIYDGPSPEKGRLLSSKADIGLSKTYTSTRNALFIVFRDSQGKEGPSSFRGKIAPEPYQHTCPCRSVDNGQLVCSESLHERSCKVKCQPSHMDLSINKDVKCALVKGEWDVDIHNMYLACQKFQSPLQIKTLMKFQYDNATCKDVDPDKIKSTIQEFIEKNSDVKAKGVCFASGGDENVDCKGKKLLVNCSGDKPARMTVTIRDRIMEPPTLNEANVKLKELISTYKNLTLGNVFRSPDFIMKSGNDSFTPNITSASPEITPLCDDPHDFIKVPGNDTSFVCSTCPLHHSYNTSTRMCDKCPPGSRASSRATSCTKGNGTRKVTPIKSPCSSACREGTHVDPTSKMCEWCPQNTYQNSSTILNPQCMPCPDQKRTSFPGAQSARECRNPCAPGSFYNASSGFCQGCPIGSYIDVDMHAFTKCKTCSVGKTTRATGSKERGDCHTRCTSGQFYNSESKMCTPCVKGKYQDKMDKDTCMDCPANKTTLNPGSKSSAECVILCRSGQFLTESNEKCDDCPMNTYQDLDQHQNKTCKSCGEGNITNATGQSSISQCFEKCSKGWFLNKSITLCEKCPAGQYQDQRGQEQCKQCSTGEYQDQPGQQQCKKCATGEYQDQKGKEQCKKCQTGEYQDQPGQEQCKKCATGENQDQKGQEQCKKCATGEYQDQKGQEQCKKCQTGEYQDQLGQKQCKKCATGEYQDQKGQEQCKKCQTGEYQDQLGQVQCKKCSDGKTTENQGTDDSKACTAVNVGGKLKISLRFLSLSWSEELKDKGSTKYIEVKTIIEAAIKFEFRKDQSFEHVKVTNLKKGSVIAEFDVSFSSKADYNPVEVLQESVYKGRVGNLSVSPQSLEILHQPCHQPLGMENGKIKDEQITASTFFKNHEPSEARLNVKGGRGWHAKYTKKTEYLQINFKRKVNITGVATQGVSSSEYAYVTEYKLSMSKDGITWHEYTENNKSKVFTGNTDAETVVRNNLAPPMQSQFIRFLPQNWNKRIYMRVEVYGCMPINPTAPSPTTDANIAAIKAKDEKWPWGAYLGIVFAILLVIGVVVAVICWMKKSQEKRKGAGTDEALMGVRKHGDGEYRVIEKNAVELDDDDENVV